MISTIFALLPIASLGLTELPVHHLMPDGRVLPTRDRRVWAFDTADDLATEEPRLQEELDRHFSAGVVRRARNAGFEIGDLRRLRDLEERAKVETPPPGGVGYGFYYRDADFRWSNSTATYQRMIAPGKPGGDVSTWLYNTTTNRAELGVEAFISYYAQSSFRFKVFDWARYPAAPWQTDMSYSTLDEYLESTECDDGVWRQELYVVNETFSDALNQWTNRVWLENRRTSELDLVYSYDYTTSNPNQNTFENGDFYGSWGPIFETFQDHDGSNKPIGWNDCVLVQDGQIRTMSTANSYLRNDDPDLSPPIFLTPNRAWAVGTTSAEPPVTLLEAEDGIHDVGELYADGWLAGPVHPRGLMLKAPGFPVVASQQHNAEFQLQLLSGGSAGGPLAEYGVYDRTTGTLIHSEKVYESDFDTEDVYQPFRFDFTAVAGHMYHIGAWSYARRDVVLDRVVLVLN